MPFLAAIVPALVGGVAATAAGAGASAISKGLQGNSGAGFQAQSANVQNPLINANVQQAGNQLSQDQAQSLASVLGQQQGVNQAQGTAQGALGQQEAATLGLAGQNGIGNQSSVYNQQQQLANQLGQMAQGRGPNPAQAQLNNTTGQNIASQAALMAGQRGAGSNAGLLAREVAQQGAATQQNAVGQAAALRAQQQLGAINALQQQQGALGATASNQVSNLLNSTQGVTGAAQNQQNLQLQGQNLAQNYGLGQQQIGLGNQGQQLQGAESLNTANIANAAQQNGPNASTAMNNANQANAAGNGIASGVGTALTSAMTPSTTPATPDAGTNASDYTSLPAVSNPAANPNNYMAEGGIILPHYAQGGQVSNLKENYGGHKSKISQYFAKGGMVKAMVSPGEKILPPNKAKGGRIVPGKAKVDGAINSYANDTVPMKLPVGAIVVPRSVTKSSNPKEAQEKFVAAIKSKKGKK